MTAPLLATATPRVALNAFKRIAARWRLSAEQSSTLLGRSGRTPYRWVDEPPTRLAPDVRERISLLVGIYEDIRLLFGDGPIADDWVNRPNRDFGDHPPLARLLAGNVSDLVVVRRYLAVARQGIRATV
jgi:uncharacterized protein (DUF2384 family)